MQFYCRSTRTHLERVSIKVFVWYIEDRNSFWISFATTTAVDSSGTHESVEERKSMWKLGFAWRKFDLRQTFQERVPFPKVWFCFLRRCPFFFRLLQCDTRKRSLAFEVSVQNSFPLDDLNYYCCRSSFLFVFPTSLCLVLFSRESI